jgi:hypothetical protein
MHRNKWEGLESHSKALDIPNIVALVWPKDVGQKGAYKR